MKSVILCLMTVLYIANAEQYNLKELVEQIKQSRQNVQNGIQELIIFHGNIDWKINTNVTSQRNEDIRLFVRVSDQTIDAIRNQIVIATEENKDVRSCIICYKTALDDLNELKTAVMSDSERCMKTARSDIEIEFIRINNLIKTGLELKTQLDDMLPSCRTGNDIESCLITKLGEVDTDVGMWQDKIKPVKDALNFAYTEIITLKYNFCISKIFSHASLDIEWTWKIATSCIGIA